MPVITIRGQMGSGAPEVGKQIATKLHIDYVDREIIERVAKRLKWPEQGILEKEAPPSTLLARIAEVFGRGAPLASFEAAYLPMYAMPLDDDSYLTGLESVIKKLAQSQSIIIRGRGSQFILKDFPESFHVLMVAAEDIRIKRIMNSQKLTDLDAKNEINRSDNSHREFVKRYFKNDLEDPVNYDIVVNTSVLGFKDVAAIIIKALQIKLKATQKQAARESRNQRNYA